MKTLSAVLKQGPLREEDVYREVCRVLAEGNIQVGDRLIPERKLAAQLHVNSVTVGRALQRLAREQIVERRPRSGTIVRRIPTLAEAGGQQSALVGLLLRSEGHVYSELAGELSRALQQAHRIPVLSAFKDVGDLRTHVAECLRRTLTSGCRHLVIDACNMGPLRHELQRMIARCADGLDRVVWIDLVGELQPPGDMVCLDMEDAIRQVVGHLGSRGHRRIGLVVHARPPDYTPEEPFGGTALTNHFLAEMSRAGLVESASVIRQPPAVLHDDEGALKVIREALRQRSRPTALFAVEDWRAVQARDVALSLGLRVPQDLALVGFYDTPWAERYQLTTVSPGIPTLAAEVVRLLDIPPAGGAVHHIVRVKTELVVRCSS